MKIVTANRLIDGAVVYLGAEGDWATDIGAAQAVEGEAAEQALLERGRAAVVALAVVNPYLMVVVRDADGRLAPQSWRERIRAFGPSVLSDPGKKAG